MPYGGGTRGTIGVWGEAQAAAFLERHGYRIIERNFHATQGEIDIIARSGDDYYFIEVKTREAGALATDKAITADKLRKLRKTIKQYCYQRGVVDGSFILAGLLVVYSRVTHQVTFRLAVFY